VQDDFAAYREVYEGKTLFLNKTDFISLNNASGLKVREAVSSSLAEPLRFKTMYLNVGSDSTRRKNKV
jgi:hypothetical protein